MGALIPLSSRLSQIGTLVVGDFVERGKGLGWISDVLEEVRDTAFLIDINDQTIERPKKVLSGKQLAEALEEEGVPMFRMCYFTVMPTNSPRLSSISKAHIADEKSGPLHDWWNGVFGHIDKAYFDENTKRSGGRDKGWPAPHDPSNLNEDYLEDSDFQDFVEELSRRDSYGVWKWIAGRLGNEDEMDQLRFDYLCGKCFLGYANRNSFPYTALRGLMHGIASGLLEVKAQDSNADVLEDLNDEFGLGEVVLPDESDRFQEFARSLREFLFAIEHDSKSRSKEGIRLKSAHLTRERAKATVSFMFSGELPRPVVQGTGKGQVTRAYKRLESLAPCSPSGEKLEIALDLA
jgi:hypothetical protein